MIETGGNAELHILDQDWSRKRSLNYKSYGKKYLQGEVVSRQKKKKPLTGIGGIE